LIHHEGTKRQAEKRIAQLEQHAAWLQGKAPTQGNATESTFCQFWAEEAGNWTNQITKLLWDNYGENVARDFTSNTGINHSESVGTIHPEAASAYRVLVRQRVTLKNILRTLRS
jgi:hypothetical protein